MRNSMTLVRRGEIFIYLFYVDSRYKLFKMVGIIAIYFLFHEEY